eukprot:COSAG06_NODE_690_length_13054_cov_5.226476_13_plen_112_part_00
MLPYLGCSVGLFLKDKAPGLMLTITSGGAAVVLNLYAIGVGEASLEGFIKPFLAVYCSLGILVAIAAKIRESLEVRAVTRYYIADSSDMFAMNRSKWFHFHREFRPMLDLF